MGCGASVEAWAAEPATVEQRPECYPNPIADKLDNAIDLKRAQLQFLAVHGTGLEDESEDIRILATDLADLEAAVTRLRMRDLCLGPPESPPDTPPDLAEGQAVLAGERLSPKQPTASQLDPTIKPLHVADRGEVFAGVMIESSALDRAQREAARNVEAQRQRLKAHAIPVGPASVASKYSAGPVRELVSKAERDAQFAADARTQHERVGVFLKMIPGMPAPFLLAEPWDKSAGALVILDRILDQSVVALGLREGLVLASIDLGVGRGLENAIGRDYIEVVEEVEAALEDAREGNRELVEDLLEQADEEETADALELLQEAVRLDPSNEEAREEMERMAVSTHATLATAWFQGAFLRDCL